MSKRARWNAIQDLYPKPPSCLGVVDLEHPDHELAQLALILDTLPRQLRGLWGR